MPPTNEYRPPISDFDLSFASTPEALSSEPNELRFHYNENTNTYYNALGPTIAELLESKDRENEIFLSDTMQQLEHLPPERTTENKMIQGLAQFLDEAETLLAAKDNEKLVEQLQAFREHACFIGAQEFAQACTVIAQRWLDLAEAGHDVFVYNRGKNGRSELWMAMEVFKTLETLPLNNDQENLVRERIHAFSNPSFVEKKITDDRPYRVIALDDFILSGARMQGSAQQLARNFHPDSIEVNVVATRTREDASYPHDIRIKEKTDDTETSIPVISAYSVPHYKNAPFPGVSVSGFWRTTDYGFGEFLLKVTKETGQELPSVTRIQAPYNKTRDGRFIEPGMDEDWKHFQDTWQLTSES